VTETRAWLLIALVAGVTFAIKGAGPATMGERQLPAHLTGVVVLLAPALLAALVVTSALADGDQWLAGANTVGVACAGLLLWRRAPVIVVVLGAAAVTALIRLVA
jgi:branched-subunit amino acid transport protein